MKPVFAPIAPRTRPISALVVESVIAGPPSTCTGADATVVALGLMVPRALSAAELLAERGIDCEVIDLRSLIPLDARAVLDSVARTGRLFTVEENPRALGWGAEVTSIVAAERLRRERQPYLLNFVRELVEKPN